MAEDYVRPPILAVEPPSRRAAAWRFRAVMALIVVILVAAIVFVIRSLTASNDNGGTIGAPAPAPASALSALSAVSAAPPGR